MTGSSESSGRLLEVEDLCQAIYLCATGAAKIYTVDGQAGPQDVGQPQRGRPDDPRGRRCWTSARHERISNRATDRRD